MSALFFAFSLPKYFQLTIHLENRGSLLLSHVYVYHNDLFSGLIFIAVGFTLIQGRFDPGMLTLLHHLQSGNCVGIQANRINQLEFMISTSKQMLGYCTSGYLRVFVSPEGASLVEKHDQAFDSLMYTQDVEAWKEHLGAEDGMIKFFESGKVLPVAEWITPEELEMHNRILKAGGYTGPFNWYKAPVHLDPPKEDVELTDEEKKITVPTLLIIPEKDFAIIKDMQVHITKSAAEDLKVEVIDAGHWAMLEAKETVERLLEEFATANGAH